MSYFGRNRTFKCATGPGGGFDSGFRRNDEEGARPDIILPLQGRCRARSAGRRGVPAGDRGIPLRQHFVLPPPLPGEDERGRACLIGVLCLRPDPASLRPNLLRPVDRESDISAMFLGAGSRAPRLEGDDEIIAHHRRAHYPGAFHPASAAPQLIPL